LKTDPALLIKSDKKMDSDGSGFHLRIIGFNYFQTRQMRNMKRFVLAAGLLISALMVQSQDTQVTQDPQAAQVLDRIGLKIKSMRSMQADFVLVIEDRKEKTKSSSSGNLLIKQNMYKINNEKSTVYFNGRTMWTYLTANNEVTITEPGIQADDFFSNPASFFTLYQRDFKYRYVRETTLNGMKVHEIDLYPKNLNQPYSRIKVFVGVKSDLPDVISSVGKDGVDYTVYLKNFIMDREISDAAFSFDATKFKKVEVVDMRGI
jgi:outer membrane lipoprotein carrier protein